MSIHGNTKNEFGRPHNDVDGLTSDNPAHCICLRRRGGDVESHGRGRFALQRTRGSYFGGWDLMTLDR